MKIDWMHGHEEWAFRNLCEHLIKELSDFESGSDNPDIFFLVSPHQLPKNPNLDRNKIILHLDSVRAIET